MKKVVLLAFILVLLSTAVVSFIRPVIADGTASYENSGTIVGGIIWENTTWTLENSPYIVTDTVQIPSNVTLTIEPGVVSIASPLMPSDSSMFLVHGTIVANGTIDNKIIFEGGGNSGGPGWPTFFDTDGSDPDAFVELDYCIIKNGRSFWWGGHCYFSLRHSELYNVSEYSHIWYPGGDIYIEYNKFINTRGFDVGHNGDIKVYIRHNLFKGTDWFAIRNWASYDTSQTIVKYNSFIDIEGIVLELPAGYSSAAMIATENYWGTNDTEVIDSMIFDKNDDIRCASFIEYLPILNEPHPDTPIMLEDVKVEINGIFKEDYDSKWRCYANITIKNNSYRNVTISWVYLNVINKTYVDETFEELNISGNETLNYVIQPEQELSANWTITTFGFTKEPKILWVLFKTPISEAYETITLTTVIPEFPTWASMPLIFIVLTVAIAIYKRRLKTTLRYSFYLFIN